MPRFFPPSGTPQHARPLHVSHPFAAGFRPATAALAIALAFAVPAAPAQPVPAQVIHGTAGFVTNGSNLTVTTTNGANTSHSAINWTSFSVPAGSVTQFVQPSTASTSINRVIETNPSQILGNLRSNGKLVLVNPWGIAVGAGAQVDTAGFTASTLAMSDADALAGRLRFAGTGAPLQVDGTIRAQGGDIVLIAPQLQAGASAILQTDGAVILAAGQQAEITGRGLEGIVMQVQAGGQAVNLGTLTGDAVGIFAGTLRHSGLVQAQSATLEGGKVVLKATGDVLVDGSIVARQGARGGSVDVLGERVGLLAGARIDASGAAGGGSVRIGGDQHGANPEVPNAQRTYVDARATIAADATQQGNGGRVIVWADDANRMHGRISARGGPQGGDGGFAEVSGQRWLDFTGRADLRAPAGHAGKLLLDPNDIVISGSHATDTATANDVFGGGSDTAYVAADDLGAQLQLSDVRVTTSNGSSSTATGHLTLAGDATVQWNSGNALTLEADNGISLAGQVSATGLAGLNGTLHLYAYNGDIQQTGGSLTVGNLLAWSNNGSVVLDQPNHVGVVAGYSGNTGSVFLFHNAGDVTIGTVTAPAGNTWGINPGWNQLGATTVHTDAGSIVVRAAAADGGSVTLQAPGNVEVQGQAEAYARAGRLSISAGADVKLATEPGSYTARAYGSQGLDITAAGAVRTSSFWPADPVTTYDQTAYAWVQGSGTGPGQGIAITAQGSDIDFGPATTVYPYRAPLTVAAPGGNILGNVSIYTGGGAAGLTLSANGSVSFGSVNSSGSYSAPAGGDITITANGNVQGGSVAANGAPYQGTTLAPDAGNVSISSSGGSITLASVSAGGGWGNASSGGGKGGRIALTALGTGSGAGNIQVAGSVFAAGAGSDGPGAGGQGGSVVVHASRDIAVGQTGSSGSVDVSGGPGGMNSSTLGSTTGAGGAAGSISLASDGGNITVIGSLNGNGGDGGTANGGPGAGNGGTIDLNAQATGVGVGNVSAGSLEFRGGNGREGGSAGSGGSLFVLADKNVQLYWLEGMGGSADSGAVQAGKGGSVEITSSTGDIRIGQVDELGNGIRLAAVSAAGGPDDSDLGRDGLGGSFRATTTSGDVRFDSVVTDGHAGGAATVEAGGNVSIGWMSANARYADALAAGKGGDITLQALSTATGKGNITVTGALSSVGAASSLGPGLGGRITLSAYRDIDVNQADARSGYYWSGTPSASTGSPGGVFIDSTTGDIQANYLYANGSRPGEVKVIAQQGNITINSVYSNGSYSSGAVDGGPITLEAPGTAPGRGNITVSGYLEAYAASSDSGAGGKGGTISVHADKDVSVYYAQSAGGYSYSTTEKAGDGGTIELISDNGNIAVGTLSAGGAYGASTGAGGGGLVHLKALGTASESGSIRSTGALSADGGWSSSADAGNAGSVRVEASSTVQLSAASASGGGTYASIGSAAGGTGGSVYLSSLTASVTVDGTAAVRGGAGTKGGNGGKLEVYAAGAAQVGGISVEGGYANAPQGSGGNAGTAIVQAGGDVTLGGLVAGGGAGNDAPGGTGANVTLASSGGSVFAPGGLAADGGGGSIGGSGGTIDVRAAVDIHAPEIEASGGSASSSSGGATGGQGGSVTLRFGSSLDTSGVDAEGSSGASGAAAHPDGGIGGAGGKIDVGYTGSGSFTLEGLALIATGGMGGDGYTGAAAGLGGQGGQGGTIDVAATLGSLVLRTNPETDEVSSLRAGAGLGGWTGDSVQAANGLPGQVNLAAATDLSIGAMTTDMLAGLSARSAGAMNVDMPIVTDGTPVSLQAPVLNVNAAIDTTGSGTAFAGPLAMAATFATTTSLAGADIDIATDRLTLAAPVNSGSARTIGHPPTPTRATRLGGADDLNTLYVAQSQVDLITAATLVIGDALNTGGITVGPIAVDPALAPNLSLVSQGAIAQDAAAGGALTAQNLNASGSSVMLPNVTVALLSGRAQSGPFEVANQGTGPLAVGTVDGTSGIVAAGRVTVTTPGTLQLVDSIAGSDAGDAVVLSAANLLAGSTAGISTPSGRWLVYLATQDGNDFGALSSGHYALWGHTFAANPPATIADSGNRYLFGSRPALDVSADAATKVYDGTSAFTLTFQASGFVDASLYQNAFAQDDLGALTGALALQNPGKNVGSYAITQGTLGAYYAIRSFTGNTATITKAPLSIGGFAASKVYDATTAAALQGTAALAGLVAGDDVVYGGATAVYEDKNVGTGKRVSVVSSALSGADLGNYLVTFAPVSGTITPASLTLSGLSAVNKVYDGTTAATTSGGTLSGVLAGALAADFVTLTAGSASFADRNVGTGKPVTLQGYGLVGSDAGNYTLHLPALGASITPAPLTVTGLKAANKVYDGTRAATTSGGTLAGVLGSDNVNFTRGSASFADRNVGSSKPVSIGAVALTGGDAGNYVLVTPASLSADITPASLTLTGFGANSKVYDGTTAATTTGGTLAGVLGSDNVNFTTGSASFADPNAGKAKPVTVQGIALTGADAGNYALQAPSALAADITPAPLTIQANSLNKQEGNELTFAGTEFSPARTGIANEIVSLVSLTTTGAAAEAKVGAYAIHASDAVGANGFVAGNYAITYLDGALAVFPQEISPAAPAIVQVNNQVVTFATLFVEEARIQQSSQTSTQDLEDAKKKKDQGNDDIIVTNNTCKPS
jgi:filamentous hemagglutinin family protein